jgi:hypothetical protein
LTDEVRLDLAPVQVTFRWRDKHVSWTPNIYVAPCTGRLDRWLKGPVALLGVGSAPNTGTQAHEVRLFEAASEPPAGVRKADCLEVFFRQALKTLFAESLFRIKPTVVVYGSRQVATAFGGFQEDILRGALLTAGARDVVFRA